MSIEKGIILDANILIRAILGKKVRNLLDHYADRIKFFTPAACIIEAETHLPKLLEKRGMPEGSELPLLQALSPYLYEIEPFLYEPFEEAAHERIGMRDPDDWPVVASALCLNHPIWTEDHDFFGAGIPTWTTDRVHLYLNDD